MGIDLVDHIGLADSRYCSFKEMSQAVEGDRLRYWPRVRVTAGTAFIEKLKRVEFQR